MTTHIDGLGEAKAEVTLARAQLSGTVAEIQSRLAPSQLLDNALNGVKTRSVDLAGTASDVVRDRPGAVAAGAAAITLLLARKPLGRLVRRIFRRT